MYVWYTNTCTLLSRRVCDFSENTIFLNRLHVQNRVRITGVGLYICLVSKNLIQFILKCMLLPGVATDVIVIWCVLVWCNHSSTSSLLGKLKGGAYQDWHLQGLAWWLAISFFSWTLCPEIYAGGLCTAGWVVLSCWWSLYSRMSCLVPSTFQTNSVRVLLELLKLGP